MESGRIEDDRVEVKREMSVNTHGNARQLGGLANAAGSEWVLWILGIDEKARTLHPFEGEVSSWWKSVSRNFVGQAPALEHQPIVRTSHGQVQALLFNVQRRPYIVRVQEHGSIKGVKASSEVPWREATATRTATREDLLRILVPRRHLPEFEVRSARLTHRLDDSGDASRSWSFSCELYVSLPWGEVAVYPDHLSTLELRSRSSLVPKGEFKLRVRAGASWSTPLLETRRTGGSDASRLDTISNGYLQVVVTGPGYLTGSCDFESSAVPAMSRQRHTRIRREPPAISAELKFRAAGHDLRATVQVPLMAAPSPLLNAARGGDTRPREPLEWVVSD